MLESSVRFVGSVANCELKAYFKSCDLYMCMSEHEGFCVPLVEAMNFKLPIIAYNSSAVPQTLGGAGYLVENKNHAEIAEAMNLVLTNSEVSAEFENQAKAQIEKFSEKTFRKNLQSLLENV